MSYFTYNGVSSETMGIEIISMPPPSRSEQNYDEIAIPGRAIPVIKTKESYNLIEHEIEFAMIYNVDTIRAVLAWLSNVGRFIRSDEADKYYTAYMTPQIESERISDNIYTLTVKFICLPFAYAISNDAVTISTGMATAIVNAGTVFCEPIYKINGSGDGVLTVNGVDLTLSAIDGYITVDSSRRIAYKDSVVLVNKTAGKYPFFATGTNYIAFSGGITSVEIIKNERYL